MPPPRPPLTPRDLADTGVLVGLGVLALVVLTDALTGVELTGAYASGAIVASMLTDARRTTAVAAAGVVTALVAGLWRGNVGELEWLVRSGICVFLAALAVVSAAVRDSREARLRRMTVIAETAQQAVLRSLPKAIGSVGLAGRYVSATAEALVGGDLYEVAATPYGVRVIVGDVRGKGLGAVQTAATVLGAFRAAAFTEPDLAALARAIDESLSRLIDDEEFVTAIVGEFGDDDVVLANCGHHPPVVVAGAAAAEVDTGEPSLPLGLGADPQLTRHAWPAGARMLFYTDGLVEARDRSGVFFPLGEHADDLAEGTLDEALDRLVERLLVYAGRSMGDDMALVLTQNNA